MLLRRALLSTHPRGEAGEAGRDVQNFGLQPVARAGCAFCGARRRQGHSERAIRTKAVAASGARPLGAGYKDQGQDAQHAGRQRRGRHCAPQ